MRRAAAAWILVVATPALAASRLGEAARASELVVEARALAEPDEFGLTAMAPGRAAKRPPGDLGPSVLVRLPHPVRVGSSWLLMLVHDEMASSLGAWSPVDPEAGVVPLDGRAGRPDDLLALADLALDPPPDATAYGARLAALVGRGDAPTSFALEELLARPDVLRAQGPAIGGPLRSMLAVRSVSPATAALAIRALPSIRERGDDVRVVDVVASEAPEIVVDAAADALRSLATPATPEHLENAIGAATSAALPGLLRLAGPARAKSLAPMLCESAGSSRPEVRAAAISSLEEIGPAALPPDCAERLHPATPR